MGLDDVEITMAIDEAIDMTLDLDEILEHSKQPHAETDGKIDALERKITP